MKSILVFYHADCPDGFGAAWATWKKFGARAEYVPIKASQTPGQLNGIVPRGRTVFFCDVCVAPATLRELVRMNKSVTVIDHHETNKNTVHHASGWVFDLKHSGSVLTWRYFHTGAAIPWLLRYIEDDDLWAHRLPHTDEITLWLGTTRFKFEAFSRLARDMEREAFRAKCAAGGRLLLDYENGIVNGVLANAYEVRFKGYRARVVNTSVSHSQVGHRLLDRRHPVSIVWYESGGNRKYSLRSEGSTDVSKLARQFPGGGGHKHASGFTLPASKPFPWTVVKSKK